VGLPVNPLGTNMVASPTGHRVAAGTGPFLAKCLSFPFWQWVMAAHHAHSPQLLAGSGTHHVTPLSYSQCHLVALLEKVSLLDAYLPIGIQKREFLEGNTFILASQYPHFSSFVFFGLYSPCKHSQASPPLPVSHWGSPFAKHVYQTQESRALLGHHFKSSSSKNSLFC